MLGKLGWRRAADGRGHPGACAVALLVVAVGFTGCVTAPQSGALARPSPAKAKSGRDALVERVVVTAPQVAVPDVLEESLTINLAQLLVDAGYFRTVKVVPGKLADGYRVKLRFDRYGVTRRIHPAYFPAAFLTATFYIWFGGPIFLDDVDLHAELKLEDPNGKVLAKKSDELKYYENISLYSSKRGTWDGGAERTRLIQMLLDGVMGTVLPLENTQGAS